MLCGACAMACVAMWMLMVKQCVMDVSLTMLWCTMDPQIEAVAACCCAQRAAAASARAAGQSERSKLVQI